MRHLGALQLADAHAEPKSVWTYGVQWYVNHHYRNYHLK